MPLTVTSLLADLLAGVRAALDENLVGVYLRGSLAQGGFDPATSDVDFFAVTERRISDAEFAALAALHERLARSDNPFGHELEGAYVERVAAWRHAPGQRFPTIARSEALAWREHGANWVIERWVVYEYGVTLQGPNPRDLIAPVTAEELRGAVRDRLRDWADFARATDDPEWRAHLGHKAYVVENMCRALCTLATGALPTKPQAVAWALAPLPEPCRGLVERSRAWHGDLTHDDDLNLEVQQFVAWTCEQASGPAAEPGGM
jgi:hypothetical protein